MPNTSLTRGYANDFAQYKCPIPNAHHARCLRRELCRSAGYAVISTESILTGKVIRVNRFSSTTL